MSTAIAKKYVNALMESCNEKELSNIHTALTSVSEAFKIAKFNNIILSPVVSQKDKESLVLSLIDMEDAKFLNFI